MTWGARYLPKLKEEGTDGLVRYLTSLFLHKNVVDLLSTTLLVMPLGMLLEPIYGAIRLFSVTIISGIGSNMLSSVTEDVCGLMVGSSSMAVGLIALGLVHLIFMKNCKKSENIISCISSVIIIILFSIVVTYLNNSSYITIMSAFLLSLILSISFITSFKNEKMEALYPWIVISVILIYFMVVYVYLRYAILSQLSCSELYA